MTHTLSRLVLALGLLGLGWAAGKAQTSQPDFELVITAPIGETSVECVRGCDLKWVERGLNPNDTAQAQFTFACRGGAVERCSSRRIGGWIRH